MVSSRPNIKVARGRVGSPAELRWREAIFNLKQFGKIFDDLVSYPYDLAEILHAALKWEVMTKCRSGKKILLSGFRDIAIFLVVGGLGNGFLEILSNILFSTRTIWLKFGMRL